MHFFEIPLYVISGAYKVFILEEVVIDNGVIKVFFKTPDSPWFDPVLLVTESIKAFNGLTS